MSLKLGGFNNAGMKPRREVSFLSDLLSREVEKIPSWLEPGILPKHGIMLLGGEAKIGKSLILGSLARSLVTGEAPFGMEGLAAPERARVLLVDQEVGEYGLQKRCRPMLADLPPEAYAERLMYVTKDPDLMLDKEKGLKALWEYVDSAQPNVLILDPVGKMISVDENDNIEIAKVFHSLERLQKDFYHLGLSIILSHHFLKPPRTTRDREGFDPLESYNFRGAGKWKDAPDTLVTVSRGDKLPLPHQAWSLNMRILPRHAEEPPDIHLKVNENRDFRVMCGSVTPRAASKLGGGAVRTTQAGFQTGLRL